MGFLVLQALDDDLAGHTGTVSRAIAARALRRSLLAVPTFAAGECDHMTVACKSEGTE